MPKRNKETTDSSSSSPAKKGKTSRASAPSQDEPIPVTILSGFLGSGKTTLLQHILTSKNHKLKIAVIVNDMASLNVDGQTIKRTKKEVVTLENGCICCTLRGDLIREINAIKEVGHFDYVLIESTGIAEPQQVAESFCVDPETQALAGDSNDMLWNSARLDTCVTVVDAVEFPNYLSSLKRFQEVFQDGLDDAEEGEGLKSISELMVEQVEFANVILLNKVDLVDEGKIQTAKRILHSLNPKAVVVTASFGNVDLEKILNARLFSMEEASKSPGWLVSLKEHGVTPTAGEADEYGFSSFVFRARKPFHPNRLAQFLKPLFVFAEDWNSQETVGTNDDPKLGTNTSRYGSILRSKGTCWIAGRDDHQMSWAQSGRILQLSPTAQWHVKEQEDSDDLEEDEKEAIEALMKGVDEDSGQEIVFPHGDRRQELVFIGTNLKPHAIQEALEECLLTDQEMAQHSTDLPLGTYPDPLFPILVPCDGPRSLFLIVRNGQNQHLGITSGHAVTLENLALNLTAKSNSIKLHAVKVWLDKTDSVKRGVLLATLRPNVYEQHSMSLSILPCDEDGGEELTNRRIRVEVIHEQPTEPQLQDIMEAVEVHIFGKIEPLPYHSSGNTDDTDDEEDIEDVRMKHS